VLIYCVYFYKCYFFEEIWIYFNFFLVSQFFKIHFGIPIVDVISINIISPKFVNLNLSMAYKQVLSDKISNH